MANEEDIQHIKETMKYLIQQCTRKNFKGNIFISETLTKKGNCIKSYDHYELPSGLHLYKMNIENNFGILNKRLELIKKVKPGKADSEQSVYIVPREINFEEMAFSDSPDIISKGQAILHYLVKSDSKFGKTQNGIYCYIDGKKIDISKLVAESKEGVTDLEYQLFHDFCQKLKSAREKIENDKRNNCLRSRIKAITTENKNGIESGKPITIPKNEEQR